MSGPPRISVVLPVYNGERYLREAIESVLAQTLPVTELIVVNDGSTDGSEAIATAAAAAEPSVRSLTVPNGGVSSARNAGIAEATGEFVAFLDHDDLWPVDSLRARIDYLLANPAAGGVCGSVVQFRDATGEEDAPVPAALPGSMAARMSAFERAGGFDPKWRIGEFVDWFARARAAGVEFATIPDVVLRRRLHDTNMGRRVNATGERIDYVRVLRGMLDRKRAAGGGDPS